MLATSPKQPGKKPEARSRVTNGSKLGDMDGRSVWARRLRDLIELYSSDIAEDVNSIPQSTKSLVRRAAVLTVELERAENGFAEKGEADPAALNAYQTTANSLRRLLESLHIKANVKDAKEVQKTIEGHALVGRYVAGMSETDRAVCFGRRGGARDLAKALAIMADNSIKTGEPLPEPIAKFLVDAGMVKFADEEVKDDDNLL